VALKVLHSAFPQNEEEMQHFVQRMKSAGSLRHANLVTIFQVGRTGPYCWVAMEYVEGESLAHALRRIAPDRLPDWQQAFRLAVHAGRGLHFAAQHHLVHRHLIPQNILYRSTDNLYKLGNLILGKALAGSALRQQSTARTIQEDLVYLSPELTHPHANADARSDLYSLGVMVYCVLTGRPPFAGRSATETVRLIREAEPARPKEMHPPLPDRLEAAVLKLLAKRPEERFQTAGEFLSELAEIAPDPG